MRGWTGVVDLPHLDNHSKELAIFTGAAVEQIEGLSVLVPELPRNPDHHACVVPGCIGEQLAEMGVVCLSQLIFDYHQAVTITRQDVQPITADRSFLARRFQIQS